MIWGERHGFSKQFPYFDNHANIPLLVWDPRQKANGRAVTELASTLDIFGTVLDAAGIALPPSPGTHSGSVVPLMAGPGGKGRDAVLYGIFGNSLCCTDGAWALIQSPDRSKPLYAYSTMVPTTIIAPEKPVDQGYFMPNVDLPQWKILLTVDRPAGRRPLDSEPLLFNRSADPGQTDNLAARAPEQAHRMRCLMRDTLAFYGAPVELFDRLDLAPLF
ncbi:MAG: sulfatase-like hydrolase/transferase [Candidatus Devosia euplotis]|nr:sulfatase-like hydrolase/transferase [Candidatus Devosia euplotis]